MRDTCAANSPRVRAPAWPRVGPSACGRRANAIQDHLEERPGAVGAESLQRERGCKLTKYPSTLLAEDRYEWCRKAQRMQPGPRRRGTTASACIGENAADNTATKRSALSRRALLDVAKPRPDARPEAIANKEEKTDARLRRHDQLLEQACRPQNTMARPQTARVWDLGSRDQTWPARLERKRRRLDADRSPRKVPRATMPRELWRQEMR